MKEGTGGGRTERFQERVDRVSVNTCQIKHKRPPYFCCEDTLYFGARDILPKIYTMIRAVLWEQAMADNETQAFKT